MEVPADRYGPETGSIINLRSHIIDKSTQARIVVVEFGKGGTAGFGAKEAKELAGRVFNTPGHTISRIIVIKNGAVLVDAKKD